MQSVIPPGDPARTVIAGKSQGFLGLAINYDTTEDGAPVMRTAYEPTDAERAAIAAGANIIMEEIARPPITPRRVYVGLPPLDLRCGCSAIVTFGADEKHARCFNSDCGAYHHR